MGNTELENKIALVTGGSNGIALASGWRFSSALFLFLVTERVNSTGPGWPGGDLFLSLPKIVGPGNPDGSFASRSQ